MSEELKDKIIYVGYEGEYPIKELYESSFGDMIGVLLQEMFKNSIWYKSSSNKTECCARIYIKTIYSDEEFENALKTLQKLINVGYKII